MSKNLNEVLNTQIANWSLLYIKLHNYHWYVKGPQFFTLHVKFEELYTEAALHVDNLAERLLALKGQPVATMREILELATVHEATGNENAEQMVRAIANDFNTVAAELKEGMAIAEAADDETTGDMLLAIHSSLEKHTWMLESFLGK
ncbi:MULTISPECIES: Dps family protein [Paenibacillus]|uniref:General stress protein n=1 Tax=Paenibacillus naphthalenovorans TaxID=162209 RepID=A0A0U2URT1_9BACL|nr:MULTISPECIES: Dps family protein [Paenibacillus]ALS24705.1 general stress protein [Paenibacillus naphthalenovorans]NTZ19598.1 DNA starvation/stationary phase protection protein [Paenibacillus sp. JMULE4]GCL73965.1 DNA starvation/stationary phase protection protein [Paenibacillus naphthalenovorans]SDJ06171.1 starvation-inducible DNA-binding protein [Paenibacillus naphthalenovorans]